MYPSHQAGPQHSRQPSQHSGPPPAKRAKGNPIITRYPPPPGYKPPQSQPSFAPQPGWQQQHVGFAPTPPNYGSYQQPLYAQQPYTQSQQQQMYPQQYVPAPHPASISTWTPITTTQSAPPQTWQNQQNGFSARSDMRRKNPLPYASNGPVLDGNGDPLPPADLTLDTDSLEEDFDAECYFARYPDQINASLSLGMVEWKAPRPGHRALPATFREAELDDIAPRPAQPSDAESISDYFINSNREESLLSVRQTDAWKTMKDDLIFKDFAAMCSTVITLSELLESYRVQFDSAWEDAAFRCSPTPELSRGPTPANEEEPPSMAGEPNFDPSQGTKSAVLDEFERALQGDDRRSVSRDERANTPAESFNVHSRTNSVSSQRTGKFTRPKPLPPIRDSKQEDILAALGVTGSPKLVYQTPGPAFGPPSTTKPGESHSRANSVSSAHSSFSGQAAPFKPRNPMPIGNEWSSSFNADVEPDNDATPRPKFKRNDSTRKRSYADTTAGAVDDSASENDEATPRQRKKQARVSDGTGSHWN